MSTSYHCDQCGRSIADLSRRIQVKNICFPSGIMLSQDQDFCDPDCFWVWTRKWPVKRNDPPHDHGLPTPGNSWT